VDVGGVALAEVGRDLGADRVELARDGVEACFLADRGLSEDVGVLPARRRA
jgi:hypothetical protein